MLATIEVEVDYESVINTMKDVINTMKDGTNPFESSPVFAIPRPPPQQIYHFKGPPSSAASADDDIVIEAEAVEYIIKASQIFLRETKEMRDRYQAACATQDPKYLEVTIGETVTKLNKRIMELQSFSIIAAKELTDCGNTFDALAAAVQAGTIKVEKPLIVED